MENKCAFVIVPHQDDEVNLVGNIMDRIISIWETYIIYTSIDTRKKYSKIRKKEALNACGVWGISKDHILFLDYPDTPNREGHHYFTDGNNTIVNDIESLIFRYMPDVIFVNDFDYHSDHRMVSIATEKAINNVIKCLIYKPIVLKAFCYETSYFGLKDYNASRLEGMKQTSNPLSNPIYEWDKRIVIKSDDTSRYIWNRKAYKALKCHKSQYAVLKADAIINSDNVFWLRRTDNLLNDAIVVTDSNSNDINKIYDFCFLDTLDFITKNPRDIDYSVNMWQPSSDTAQIHITLNTKSYVKKIVFYGNVNISTVQKVTINIIVNGEKKYSLSNLREFGRSTELYVDELECETIDVYFEKFGDSFAISQIEVLGDDPVFNLVENSNYLIGEEKPIINTINDFVYGLICIKEKIRNKINYLFWQKRL